MSRSRGFTLLELMIASAIAMVALSGAFAVLIAFQRSATQQAESNEVVSSARLAMEVLARDIRAAGDSMELLPGNCLGAAAHPQATASCPAVLEPHPWRIALARNAWSSSTGQRSRYQVTDVPPANTRAFSAGSDNVVLYRFVPNADYGSAKTLVDADGSQRNAFLGRIERVVNPYGFNGEAPQVSVLIENVLLDDHMRVNPANPTETDTRYDYALFMYQVLTRSGELSGSLANRSTGLQSFLTPPLRFFQVQAPPDLVTAPPYMPDAPAEVVGLETTAAPQSGLLATGSKGMQASVSDSDLRLILDRDRIRVVRIAFKVVGRERPENHSGIDLDGDLSNGTAPIYSFETTAELKPLAQDTEL